MASPEARGGERCAVRLDLVRLATSGAVGPFVSHFLFLDVFGSVGQDTKEIEKAELRCGPPYRPADGHDER
jgi:hypothetical protein